MGIRFEKCDIRRFHGCADVTEYTYINLGVAACYTNLYNMFIVLETVGNCNTMVSIYISKHI